ncbi:MAG: hypothetical protein ALECFALPRED_002208 [Alectoria fallacina]|uniref:Uncharacterized protein n=1 Tax=Alectoria fallacina TaxID=1903189 RepID=A0A8H3HXD1_9LECA|nr:MAG: hypothetical protein ALECFALPRED_002208 [Alectoria fallacina]
MIDVCSHTDKDGNHDQLRFPPFHTEVLTQTWANPAQNIGRIKIVIAEGINHGPGVSAFERTKNLVSFSFQHAPLHILENCGIAWPNQGLYFQAAQQFHNVSSPHTQAADPDTHAHSPRRRNASMVSARAKSNPVTGPLPSPLPGFRPLGLLNDDPFWSQHGPLSRSLAGGANLYSYRKPWSHNTTTSGDVSMKDRSRSTSDIYDEPMPDVTRPPSPATSRRSHPVPDYSRPQSLTSSRQVSWYTDEDYSAMRVAHLNYVEGNAPRIDEQESESLFNDLMIQLSPRKYSGNSGISAPSNTRVNSAANTPPGKPSMAAELGAGSFAGMPRSVSVTTRDPVLHFNTHVPSNNSANSDSDNPRSDFRELEFDDENGEEIEDKPEKKPVGRPAENVKSRKEGRTSEMGLEIPSSKSQRRASASSASALGKENNGGANGEKSGEGKRKRVTKGATSKANPKDRLDNTDSSPTRKVSKLSPEDTMNPNNDIDDLTAEGVVMRVPLRELDNVT